jgi:lysophospholipase L1-like esterase
MRFHRPTAGLGLNVKAVASIRAARKLESIIPLWSVEPANELLSGRGENEAYLAVDVDHQSYVVYFPAGGEVQVDVSDVNVSLVAHWIDINSGEWGPTQNFNGGDSISVAAPGQGNWAVTIIASTEPPSATAPIANAGADQNLTEGDTVTLDGSGSTDPDGTITAYEWKEGGIVLSTAVSFEKSDFSVGSHTIILTVTDNNGSTGTDSMTVTVVPLENTSFTDDFSTDTTSQYIIEDTWTDGGVGSFSYDGSGEHVRVLTGNDVALQFSRALSASIEGSFSIDFLPTVYYPSGGIFTLKLIQDANIYYQIKNTDGYGPLEISKYVNGIKVDSALFANEYTQGITYTITITFSPSVTIVEAFGQTLTMNSDSTAITVSSFAIETLQQDAFYDNIVYSVSEPTIIQLITPQTNHIQTDRDLTTNVLTVDLTVGWGVKFALDEGDPSQQIVIDVTQPYEVTFVNVELGEHRIDCYIVDESQNEQPGEENHDSAENIGIGDILIAVGDSITFGYGDNNIFDDISADGRKTGGGFEPILNDYLSGDKGYPHSIINEGISGETTQEGLLRLPSVLTKYPEASTFLLLYGTNNTSPIASQPLESGKRLNVGDVGYDGTYKDYMQQMIDLVNSAGKKAAIAKIPVALGTSSSSGDYSEPIDDEYRNVKTRDFNEAIDELVADPSNNIVATPPDFYTYFRDINIYEAEYFDNLHPNGAGYSSIADLWRDALIE